MQSYKLIKGSDQNISSFEQQVSEAIDEGYEFSSELITKTIINPKTQESELVFLQPMALEEGLELDEDFFVEEEAAIIE